MKAESVPAWKGDGPLGVAAIDPALADTAAFCANRNGPGRRPVQGVRFGVDTVAG